MAKIYQTFELVPLSSETFQGDEYEASKKLQEVGEKLIQKLKSKGYTILVSGVAHCGVPERIMIAAELGSTPAENLKTDFNKAANELGLAFCSLDWFREV